MICSVKNVERAIGQLKLVPSRPLDCKHTKACLKSHLGMDGLLLGDFGLGGLGLLGGRRRELGGLLGGRGREVAGAQNLGHLASVVASILLSNGGEVVGLLLSGISNLGGLGVDGIGSGLELLVDELLVGGVDQGGEEGNGGCDNGENPVGHHLDEEAGNEGSDAGLEREKS